MSHREAEGGDAALAERLAREAGDVLLGLREATDVAGRELGDLGDAAAQSFLGRELARLMPGDAVLSEEAADDRSRLGTSRVWIIDPLDGTREYCEGRDDWAVHVALWADGELAAGAVAVPASGQVFGTSAGRQVSKPRREGPLQFAVSRSRPPQLAYDLADRFDARLVPMGSAGVKTMAVVTGQVDAYVHAGGQYEWDSAAPVAVARAYGLHTSRIDGEALRYNRVDPRLPDLLVCRPELRESLLEAIADVHRVEEQ